jgi:2-polyprenyl-3-methyl-5-hydroxy-6-metoxy-1,4-benzoquinol methylase
VEQQNAYNAAVTEVLGGVYQRVDEIEQRLVGVAERVDAHVEASATWRETVDQLQQHAGESDAWLRALEARIEEARQVLQSERALREDREEAVRLRLQRLENWRRGDALHEQKGQDQDAGAATSLGFDYYLLGARYRNTVSLASRLGDYDDLFSDLAQSQQAGRVALGPVLDIGAGRGEFVEHLQSLGLQAYGIDLDADAVSAALAAGRNVRLAEGLTHLRELEDGSLAAVVMLQVAEHLEIEELLSLWRLCWQKLANGGLLLAETINPTCLWSMSNWYLLDPSHKTLLHPEMARFLLEQAGLQRVEFRFLRPVPAPAKLETLPGEADDPLVRTMNDNVERLNALLYGPQDYAAIAWKREE